MTLVQRFKKLIDRSSGFSLRRETRVLKTLSLKYKDKKSFVNAYTGNLSNGGLFIKAEKPLKQGEQFFLNLQLPDLPEPLKIKCQVAWARGQAGDSGTTPAGMGVKFIEMTKKDNQMLKQYLKQQ